MNRRKLTRILIANVPGNLPRIFLCYLTDMSINYCKKTKMYPTSQIISKWVGLLYKVERNYRKGSRYGFTRKDQRMLRSRSSMMLTE
jgi:hypothetical protein